KLFFKCEQFLTLLFNNNYILINYDIICSSIIIKYGDFMKKQNAFIGFILIAIGIYFILQNSNIPALEPYKDWPTLLVLIGLGFVLYGYFKRDYNSLFPATIVLGIGVHFFGLTHLDFWVDHWAVYILIIGAGFIIRALRTKKGFGIGFILILLAILLIFSSQFKILHPLYANLNTLKNFWPILLIIIGLYLIKRKK